MSDPADLIHDDNLVEAANDALRFRYRAFITLIVLLSACVTLYLIDHESRISRGILTLMGPVAGIGVPWLLWHLRVTFTARVAMPILFLSGQALNGQDPRESLDSLAALPVATFFLGWGIDLCLRQDERRWSFLGRFLFSAFWIYLAWSTYLTTKTNPEAWSDLVNIVLGTVTVWLPRECLVPRKYRLGANIAPLVVNGLRFAGGWIASRTAIAILIILPSVIYLDLLDFPPHLRSEIEASPAWQKSSVEMKGDPGILYWKREARALLASDLQDGKLEVHVALPKDTEAVVGLIRELRANPQQKDIPEKFIALSARKVTDIKHLAAYCETESVFYLDRLASGDERVTSGLLSTANQKWSNWVELRTLKRADVTRIEKEVGRATIIILANGILVLLLLGGPSGGTPTAWWLAILLAGTNLHWLGESFEMGLDRARFAMWREFADQQVGATLFSVHGLLVSFVRLAEWLTSNAVAYAGIWVALCWPGRTTPSGVSRIRHFWIQAAKVCLLSVLILGAYSLFNQVTGANRAQWNPLWHFLFPLVLLGTGVWRRRRCVEGGVSFLPVAGGLVLLAFLLRGWSPFLVTLEGNASSAWIPWIGYMSLLLGIVAPVLLIIALERGVFLSPPHVEGQVWLIGIAAIPFLENVIAEPVSRLIEGSGLFLGTTVGWLVFAAAIWVVGPVSHFFGEQLSRWKAKGLDTIGDAHERLKNLACSRETSVPGEALALCDTLCERLDIIQPQFWKHLNGGFFERLIPLSEEEAGEKLISRSLAEALGEVDSSLRLEEMRMEWKWAAYHAELNQWFDKGGDLLLVPAIHKGSLLGLFCSPDLPENRFLLRPAVSRALGETLATAILLSANRPDSPKLPDVALPAASV